MPQNSLKNKREILFSRIKLSLKAILIIFSIVFAVLFCFFLFARPLSLGAVVDVVQIVLLIGFPICFPYIVAYCVLGNILKNISVKRTCYYFLIIAAVFFLGDLVVISIWQSIPYGLTYPAASDMLEKVPAYFTAFDSMGHFLHYAIFMNLRFALTASFVFTVLMLLVNAVNRLR